MIFNIFNKEKPVVDSGNPIDPNTYILQVNRIQKENEEAQATLNEINILAKRAERESAVNRIVRLTEINNRLHQRMLKYNVEIKRLTDIMFSK